MEWRKVAVLAVSGLVGSVHAQSGSHHEIKRQVIGLEVPNKVRKTGTSTGVDEAASATGFEFMGITLGGPLVRECPQEHAYGGNLYNVASRNSACWATFSMRPDPRLNTRNNRTLPIAPMDNKRPTGTHAVTAIVVDGRIEGLNVETDGFRHANELLGQLKQKLGTPTLQETTEVISGVGARFSSPKAVWDLPDAYVQFNGIVDTVDAGLIVVLTQAQRAREMARQSENEKSF
ncbi:hypothetical protein GUV62_07975 [Stenotrophomonas maltophilia]|uniref:hypothetical protein n=1 Tax=Stenotrophomonas maltophilia TaxID=40324 RepID=UPI001F4188A3|nr:hypothetical protein [Stenotrophomonas maltophilia]MCF3492643.1 hypothetical protein [Stenotrophomonas maltophilia]MCF3512478.1 hypothetical protein [Stenotrophomonas maltophilia]